MQKPVQPFILHAQLRPAWSKPETYATDSRLQRSSTGRNLPGRTVPGMTSCFSLRQQVWNWNRREAVASPSYIHVARPGKLASYLARPDRRYVPDNSREASANSE